VTSERQIEQLRSVLYELDLQAGQLLVERVATVRALWRIKLGQHEPIRDIGQEYKRTCQLTDDLSGRLSAPVARALVRELMRLTREELLADGSPPPPDMEAF